LNTKSVKTFGNGYRCGKVNSPASVPQEKPVSKTKIVYLTTIPMTLNLFLGDQMAYMVGKGLDVSAVSSPGPELLEVQARCGIPVQAIPMPRKISPIRDILALVRLWRLFRAVRPNIVHASTAKAGLLSMLAACMASVPVRIYTVRGLITELGEGPLLPAFRAIERTICRCATRVYAVSRSVADGMISQGLCGPELVRVLESGSSKGVDAQNRFNRAHVSEERLRDTRVRLGIPEGSRVIGFVGRVVRDKGIIELASAWRSLRELYDGVYLLVIGPEELQDPVPSEIVQELQADPRVRCTGYVANHDMPAYYGMMDVAVLPTYREGFPNVPLEAAAMRLPVVATTVTGCVDAVVHGVTGMLIPPRDSGALAGAIKAYLDDPVLRRRHGQAGRDRVVREFDQERIWQALYREYLELLGENPPQSVRHGG